MLAGVLAVALLGVLGSTAALAGVPNPNQWGDLNRGQPIPEQNAQEQLGKEAVAGTPGADDRAATAWRALGSIKGGVVVGELDTGVEYGHPDLAENIWTNPGEIPPGCEAGTRGFNTIERLEKWCNPADEDSAFAGHGTNVAGIIAATGKFGEGVQGIDPRATVLPVKWLKSAGGSPPVGEAELVEAIDQLLAEKKERGVNIRVVNDSPVFPGSNTPQPAVENAIKELGAAEILFVTAAGNNSKDIDGSPRSPHYPCSYKLANEICVSASTSRDQLAGWANWGKETVDLAAPGESIWSTQLFGKYGYLSGGSMAAAQVSGAAALVLSVEPWLSVKTLKEHLLNTVRPDSALSGRVRTGGVLNVCKAVPGCSEPKPSLTKVEASPGQRSATIKGEVNPNGYSTECAVQYGPSPGEFGPETKCSPSPGQETSPVAVSVSTGETLTPATTYSYRVAVKNAIGPAEVVSFFKTEAAPPSVKTEPVTEDNHTTATLNATVNPNGASVGKCLFEYGPSKVYGKTLSCSTMPGGGVGGVRVAAAVAQLEPDATYHFRIAAENSKGPEVFGADETFTTVPLAPTVVTGSANSLSETGATLNATVNPNGAQMKECLFEYGTSTSYGTKAVCAASPVEGTTAVPVSAAVTGLTQGTTYHYRIIAVNNSGTGPPGEDATFTTVARPVPPPLPPPVELAAQPSQGSLPFTQEAPPKPAGARLLQTTLTLARSGVVLVTLTCPASEVSCSGTVALRTLAATAARRPSIVLATAAFTIAGGHSRAIKMHLSTHAKQMLGRSHTVHGRSTTVTHALAGLASSTQAILLKIAAH